MSTLSPNIGRQQSSIRRDDTSTLPSLSRSPHPYHRRTLGESDKQQSSHPDGRITPDPHISSPARSSESGESGTEADDERGPILKSLPAPPLRARKGLRGSTPYNLTPAISPPPTPPAEVERDAKSLLEFAGIVQLKSRAVVFDPQKRQEYSTRRRKEICRRITETLLLFAICCAVWRTASQFADRREWQIELLAFAVVLAGTYATYPILKVRRVWNSKASWKQGLYFGLHVPSRFDTGHLIYPTLIPVLASLSLLGNGAHLLVFNLVTGIASMPVVAVAFSRSSSVNWQIWWILTLLPLHVSAFVDRSSTLPSHGVYKSSIGSKLSPEDIALMFPLHQALTSTLEFLTTTSLERSELQLLSTSLLNLYFFANSPQAIILKVLLWLGGVSLFISCQHLLRWEVALARIPNWKFARHMRKKNSFLRQLDAKVCHLLCSVAFRSATTAVSDSDEPVVPVVQLRSHRPSLQSETNGTAESKPRLETLSAIDDPGIDTDHDSEVLISASVRRNSFNSFDTQRTWAVQKWRRLGKRWTRPLTLSFTTLTSEQALVRKYFYAGLVYVFVVLTILLPIRLYIKHYALGGHDPFTWAVGYLLGNNSSFRLWVVSNNLEEWIALPARAEVQNNPYTPGSIEYLRQIVIGPAAVRLLIAGYCLCVLSVGIGVVLVLTSLVEVDTRRKVFHGIMVAMLLPTIFIDPCFIALALSLILAIFLLLDLFRASQLPPVSKPLTNFLAPYVDGRDHRGPVIVSHIFLLIGCAIPLWLSLAGTQRSGLDPWASWDVVTPDLSMVSGVICVGMGDAAASLIGRRYGKTKWYWVGGKSLEGSVAFATAVTIGLMASHAWLRLGGWYEDDKRSIVLILGKSTLAGMGASLLESTLTAANDNVVVPVGLWLLVRGLNI